ncbi:hypothetical protein RND81_14G117400 [Saponaria officinalis]|uniref:Pre-mRNA cleavage factor Im 25 kDa subunit n=1 Tax=Saponaria officinalis TaxID=3572 RepID=A0AAW1GNT5_SAPOF
MLNSPIVSTYTLSRYTFLKKDERKDKDSSFDARISRIRLNYSNEGMRRTVEGVLLIQEHNFPHVLLFKIENTFYKLPGGKLRPGENEIEGLQRKLSTTLAPNDPQFHPNWQIRECLSIWWRPNFDSVLYPYCPPHITRPKECRKVYVVQLSERQTFAVPRNFKLVAVPLFDLYDNVGTFGPVISNIPEQLSRFRFNYISP